MRRGRPVSGHYLALMLDEHGVHGEFGCDEPDSAPCHQWCEYGCETGCHHPRNTVEKCQPLELLESDGSDWWDSYIGPDCEPRSGPIIFEWSDDYYAWRYEEQENNGEIEKETMT